MPTYLTLPLTHTISHIQNLGKFPPLGANCDIVQNQIAARLVVWKFSLRTKITIFLGKFTFLHVTLCATIVWSDCANEWNVFLNWKLLVFRENTKLWIDFFAGYSSQPSWLKRVSGKSGWRISGCGCIQPPNCTQIWRLSYTCRFFFCLQTFHDVYVQNVCAAL